jgi:hypothetical protein
VTDLERFMSYVLPPDENGCEMWTGARHHVGGYGVFWARGLNIQAHRYRYIEQVFGDFSPPSDVFIRHSCHNPGCVALAHLTHGSPADNSRDMVEANRQARGIRHGLAKLTADEVIEARRLYAAGGVTHKALAEKYGIGLSTMSWVLQRRTWRHLPEEEAAA